MSSYDDEWPMMMEREAGMAPNVPPVSVCFGLHPVLDSGKSKEAGYEVYKDVEFVKIAVPGDRTSLYFQPARQRDRDRFPKAYAAFKARQGGEEVEGLRIEMWPAVSRSMVLMLKAMHIHTVEALAACHDGHIDRVGTSGRELRDKARTYLETAKDSAAAMKLADEKKALQDQIAGLQAQMQAMSEQMAAMQKNAADRPDAPQPVPQTRGRKAAA